MITENQKLSQTFDFAVGLYPKESRIARAKASAVGGKRKRCTKGKNCSAACIAANMVCLVDLPWAGPALGQARQFILSRRQGEGGKSERVMRWTDRPRPPAAGAKAPAPKKPAAVPAKPSSPKIKSVSEYKALGLSNLEKGLKFVDKRIEKAPSPVLQKIRGNIAQAIKELKGPSAQKVPTAKPPSGLDPKVARLKRQAKGMTDSELANELKAGGNHPRRKKAFQDELALRGKPVPTTEAAPAPRAAAAKAPAAKPPEASPPPRKPQSQRNKDQSFYEDDGSYNPREQINRSGKILGQGAFGMAKQLKNGDVVKDGQIGQYEAAALKLLEDTGVTPKLKGVMYNASGAPKTVGSGYGGHVRERKGFLGMEGAQGQKLGNLWYGMNSTEKDRAIDAYIQARAKIHRKGVAHNDMHGGNIYYDPKTGKLTVIDLGLAQINPKAALVEAMGTLNGRDWQADRWKVERFDTPAVNQLKQNLRAVQDKLKNQHGIDAVVLPKIRASEDSLSKVFGNMTNSEAQSLVNLLYKGIGTVSQKGAPAKAPTQKPVTTPPSKKDTAYYRNKLQEQVKQQEAKAPAPKAQAAKPKAQTKPTSNSFYDPASKNKFDFSAEEAKPGVITVTGGAQAKEGVKINHKGDLVMKKGDLGQYEAAAFERLKDAGITPAFKGIRYEGSRKPDEWFGDFMDARKGRLAMGVAPGREIDRQIGRVKETDNEIGDKLIQARKAMHLRDVAHNDMHGGNVYYDPKTKKLTVIDLGLAQISPKAALIEAMGGITGKDYQGEELFRKTRSPLRDKLEDNVDKVYKKLKDQGLDPKDMPGIRSTPSKIDRYFGSMADSEARQLIKEIYDGI